MIMKNAEITAIRQIMGLQHGKKYEDTKSLRYGHLMIMTDQDHDGSHIKGLIINFLETFYPSLLAIPGFLIEFITPIVRVWKKDQSISFFTLPEYEYWKETTPDYKKWEFKYFKVCPFPIASLLSGFGNKYGPRCQNLLQRP
jgi:DNA topoisomerase II